MRELMRRKHQRCTKDTAITYSFLNKAEQYEAVARNHSRFGLYFEAHKSLAPGTLIVIRDGSSIAGGAGNTATRAASDGLQTPTACPELNTQVVGEVKRCKKLEETTKPRYGIAVRYISPAG